MISVIIPAYNEEKLIANCLEGLVLQKTNKKFEVILVDNNSTDKTALIAQKYKKRLDLKIISEPRKGRGTARFAGFKKAKGTILFSTDADTIVPPNWIERFCEELEKGDSAAVAGTIIVNDLGPFKNYAINNFYKPLIDGYRYVSGHYWLAGFSFAIFKDAYEKSGGFDPGLTNQEDMDLSFKVSRIGKIKLIKDTPVLFSGRRYKNGIIIGFIPNIKAFVSIFWFKKSAEILDIR